MRVFGLTLLLLASLVEPFALLAEQPVVPSDSPATSDSVDLRPSFERFRLGRRLQGDRPTCSVFTVAGALEFAVAERQGHTPRLSVEFLNWAANQACGDKDDGGFFSDLWKGFAAYGICTESDMPYESKFEAGRQPSAAAVADAKTRLSLGLRLNWIKEWNVKTGLSATQLDSIKRTLAGGWPVCGGFRWPKQEQWVGDVLQLCPADAVRDGHSILLVGYRENKNQPGGGVFLFRNTSHGGKDGEMPYSYASDYMNDAVWVDFEKRGKPGPPSTAFSALFHDPLGTLVSLPAGRNRRISSNEQPKWNDANLDMTVLPPGKAVEMPLLEGPGMITHIWMTSHAGRANELNALSLRVYWDGREEPGVEVPLGEFFAGCRVIGACLSPSQRGLWWLMTIPIVRRVSTGRWTGWN